jgi:hypothetical protein
LLILAAINTHMTRPLPFPELERDDLVHGVDYEMGFDIVTIIEDGCPKQAIRLLCVPCQSSTGSSPNHAAADDTSEEAWDSLLKEAADRRITITELMRRALPFFSFGRELAEKYRGNSFFK